jgi:hypothetical protein
MLDKKKNQNFKIHMPAPLPNASGQHSREEMNKGSLDLLDNNHLWLIFRRSNLEGFCFYLNWKEGSPEKTDSLPT